MHNFIKYLQWCKLCFGNLGDYLAHFRWGDILLLNSKPKVGGGVNEIATMRCNYPGNCGEFYNWLHGYFWYQYKVMCFIILLSSLAWLIFLLFSSIISSYSYYYYLFNNAIFTPVRKFMILMETLIGILKNTRQATVRVLFSYAGQMQVVRTYIFKIINTLTMDFKALFSCHHLTLVFHVLMIFKFHEENNPKK